MTATNWPDLTRTQKALEVYATGQAERDRLLDAVSDNESFIWWAKKCQSAMEKLREAYYLDTQDRNTREHCELIGVYDIQRIVRAWQEQKSPE